MERKNVYDGVLSFKGTWRNYQRRVLEEAGSYLADGKIHIAAAPGAGKTTLGIELIRRTGHPCLILSPRIVIREQWLGRIQDSFLIQKEEGKTVLSNDLKNPGLITSVTYQTLYSSLKGYKGLEKGQEGEEGESVDFSDFHLLEKIREAGIKTICLDECHHLKNQWWKALEEFMKEMEGAAVISLTATPPYDAAPVQWERYIKMCGEIDAEITIPELVKEGSLCPHQDYVYFSYPTGEEERQIEEFRITAEQMLMKLLGDSRLKEAAASHKALMDYDQYYDQMLETPSYLASVLILCQCMGIPFSPSWLQVLGVEGLPDMSEKWMEIFLQGFLYEDKESYQCLEDYQEKLKNELKAAGLTDQGRVCFCMKSSMERMLARSGGKLDSISRIVSWEYAVLREKLRMLILTDYVRKETVRAVGAPQKPLGNIGVLPVFELLRRQGMDWKLGVLCGSFLLLPEGAKDEFLKETALAAPDLTPELKVFTDSQGEALGYAEAAVQGKQHIYVQVMTRLFEKGEIQILIGTKALLGEGWDSPCINSLILASSVGSYVLGNQMRGRAVRMDKNKPDKVSNIWHLVCMPPPKEHRKNQQRLPETELSPDFAVLKRRMEGIMGLRYDGGSIENGMERLTLLRPPYEPAHIQKINGEMEELSANREIVARQWREAVCLPGKIEIACQCGARKSSLGRGVHFYSGLGAQIFLVLMQICNVLIRINITRGTLFSNLAFFLFSAVFVAGTFFLGKKLIWWLTPMSRYKALARGLLETLKKEGHITSLCRTVVEEEEGIHFWAWLQGGTDREKNVFAQALEDMLEAIDNQRYLLVYGRNREKPVEYFCVPRIFSGTKEKADNFRKDMEPYIGRYRLVYTRNPEGRKLLLRGRANAFSNKNQRILYRKKTVKGALE